MSDDPLPFTTGDVEVARSVVVTERRCRHPRDQRLKLPNGDQACLACNHVIPLELIRRGKNNKKRGIALSAKVAKSAGIENRERMGLPSDSGNSRDWLITQNKSGGSFPRTLDRWLRAITVNANQLRGVVCVETGTPGRKARRVILLDFDELIEWYGSQGIREVAA